MSNSSNISNISSEWSGDNEDEDSYDCDPLDESLFVAITQGPAASIQASVQSVLNKAKTVSPSITTTAPSVGTDNKRAAIASSSPPSVPILDRWLYRRSGSNRKRGQTFLTTCVGSVPRTHGGDLDRDLVRITAFTALLQSGANPNRISPTGDTLIELMCRRRVTLPEFELAAKYGIIVATRPQPRLYGDETPSLLHKMVAEPLDADAKIQPGTIRWLIEHGVDGLAPFPVYYRNHEGQIVEQILRDRYDHKSILAELRAAIAERNDGLRTVIAAMASPFHLFADDQPGGCVSGTETATSRSSSVSVFIPTVVVDLIVGYTSYSLVR